MDGFTSWSTGAYDETVVAVPDAVPDFRFMRRIELEPVPGAVRIRFTITPMELAGRAPDPMLKSIACATPEASVADSIMVPCGALPPSSAMPPIRMGVPAGSIENSMPPQSWGASIRILATPSVALVQYAGPSKLIELPCGIPISDGGMVPVGRVSPTIFRTQQITSRMSTEPSALQSARAAIESGHAAAESPGVASTQRTCRITSRTSDTPSPFTSHAGEPTQILPGPKRAKVGQAGRASPVGSATIVSMSQRKSVCGGVSGATE